MWKVPLLGKWGQTTYFSGCREFRRINVPHFFWKGAWGIGTGSGRYSANFEPVKYFTGPFLVVPQLKITKKSIFSKISIFLPKMLKMAQNGQYLPKIDFFEKSQLWSKMIKISHMVIFEHLSPKAFSPLSRIYAFSQLNIDM